MAEYVTEFHQLILVHLVLLVIPVYDISNLL